ncbi:MAG: acetyltransferase, family, partial [Myxococcaceae bacterium]|nr:acetyltransferase, family [Myxococcaceae bacterium]
LARLRGCTHLVLEVAENNRDALVFYKHRGFQKMDAAIFMAQKIDSAPDLLPPRKLKGREERDEEDDGELGGTITIALDSVKPGKGPGKLAPKKKRSAKKSAKKRSSERPKKAATKDPKGPLLT